ncbi:hypothetical protein [uncultured Algoriphagus sp.]|uniref:hypothetical protein n=1 Tax=uncultured Algoriphagus sp. TaxID=417365 RepID=UPI00258876A8|nr:hypothetical protein [uncultured Algoriphagus sp.]
MNRLQKTLIALAAVGFLFTACQKEDEAPISQLEDSEEVNRETDLNGTLEDIDDIVLTGFQRNGFADRTVATVEEDLCERVDITWLPNEKKMILDFGDGCTSPRGITRKGKVIVNYTGRYWAPGSVITTTFEDFYINERKIEGVRIVRNEGFNQNDRFFTFITRVEGGKITWPDGTTRTFESRHTKRIFLPNGDRGFIYAVDGGSEGINRRGNSYRVEITDPLIYAQRCINTGIKIPSKGLLTLNVSERPQISVDFGDEGCDREVTISRGDQSRTITIPRG